jgi:HTH-type transcriptional regulator / antitoxin HipB
MTYIPRLSSELGDALRQRREELGFSKTAVADRAGRVREVIYRLERGEEASVSSLLDVLRALNLVMRIEPAGLPTMEQVSAAFNKDDDS